jgi:hypothetical protein
MGYGSAAVLFQRAFYGMDALDETGGGNVVSLQERILVALYDDNGPSGLLGAMREPDPKAVAAVADQLGMDATKVAAVWMLLIDEALK